MIEVGNWLHVKPGELSCERITPTQLNKYKNRVQEPYLRLMIGETEVLVNGRKMFWALLDALFANDPLPRIPVNEFLQNDPNEFLFDLNSFFDESKTPYISIMLGEVLDPFSTVGAMWSQPAAVIITANAGLKAPDCVLIADRHNGVVIPGSWADNKGFHEVPCVLINGNVHITDLGDQLIVGGVLKTKYGDNVRPLKLDAVRKGVNWPSILSAVIEKHIWAIGQAKGRIYPPSKGESKANTSSAQARNELELFLRGHQE